MPKQKPKGMAILAIGSIPMILVLGNSMLIPDSSKNEDRIRCISIQSQLDYFRIFDFRGDIIPY